MSKDTKSAIDGSEQGGVPTSTPKRTDAQWDESPSFDRPVERDQWVTVYRANDSTGRVTVGVEAAFVHGGKHYRTFCLVDGVNMVPGAEFLACDEADYTQPPSFLPINDSQKQARMEAAAFARAKMPKHAKSPNDMVRLAQGDMQHGISEMHAKVARERDEELQADYDRQARAIYALIVRGKELYDQEHPTSEHTPLD